MDDRDRFFLDFHQNRSIGIKASSLVAKQERTKVSDIAEFVGVQLLNESNLLHLPRTRLKVFDGH